MEDSAQKVRIKAHWKKDFNCLSMLVESDLVVKTSEGKSHKMPWTGQLESAEQNHKKQIKRDGICKGDGLEQQ